MNGFVIISGTVAVIGLGLFIAGLYSKGDSLFCSGIMIVVIGIIGGFGILCTLLPSGESKITYKSPQELIKGKTSTFTKYNDTIFSSDSHALFIAQEQDIKIKITQGRNAWGYVVVAPKYELVIIDQELEKEKNE